MGPVSRDEVVDVGAAVVATALAVVGFRTSFEGSGYLVAGLVAAVGGGLVSFAITRLRLPGLVGAAAAVVGFVVFSGVAVPSEAILGFVPTPWSVGDLVDGAVNGWADLLTTIPPAGQEGNLLAIPYLCGYVAAAGAVALARGVSRVPLCAAPPIVALAVSVLFGTDQPASLLLQGGVFAGVLLVWLSAREARRHDVVVRRRSRSRTVTAAGMLGTSVVVGLLAGPSLPLADANQRYILRDRVEPEFNPNQYPSPLAGYRNYTGVDVGEDAPAPEDEPETFLVADGLPEAPTEGATDGAAQGTPVRIAVMDSYDGLVWNVGGDERSGAFRGVGGERLPGSPPGEEMTVSFEVMAQRGVWLPSIGSPAEVRFSGHRADALRSSFRFNDGLRAGAVAAGLGEGDRYEVTAVVPAPGATDAEALAGAVFDPAQVRPLALEVDQLFATRAAEAVSGFTSDHDKALRLEQWFRVGNPGQRRSYSDGGDGMRIAPGHSLFRLGAFLSSAEDLRGNSEQYAAAMGLLAVQLGMPARVVLGFWPDEDSPGLTSESAEAWVEIAFVGAGWVPFRPTPDRSQEPPEETEPEPEPKEVASEPPPPTTVPPPPTIPEEVEFEDPEDDEDADLNASGGGLPRFVLYGLAGTGLSATLVLVPCAVVLALKARRRRRRRITGFPAHRIAKGWVELVDLARDMGNPVPARATRHEVASYLSLEPVAMLAARADGSTFGAEDPDEGVARSYWDAVDAARSTLLGALGRRARLRAVLNLASLRGAG